MCRDIAEYAGTVQYSTSTVPEPKNMCGWESRSLTVCCWEPQTNLPTKRNKRLRHQAK